MRPAYSREDYPTIRAASQDWMPDTFDEWQKNFDARQPYIRINPRLLKAWLGANGLESTEETRGQYAEVRSRQVRSEYEQRRRERELADEQKLPIKRRYDPSMPHWANQLQDRLSDWWARHGLW